MSDKSQVPGSRAVLETYVKASDKIIQPIKQCGDLQGAVIIDIDADARRVASKVPGIPENQLDVLAAELDQLEPKAIYEVDIIRRDL